MSEASRISGQTQQKGRVGTVVNGKWRIDERIGSGGMSTVYAATGPGGERVALKMLHSQLGRDADVRARFLREAYVANVVNHPGIVRVLGDAVAEDGAVYLVLELLVGETLEALRVGAHGALPIDEVLDVAELVLDALAAAHAQNIIHRDIKPENVFVTTEGAVKLLDFGLARMRLGRQETTKTGVTIGTPEFMPPEQAGGRRDGVDERSDVWGVGAMIFTSITGQFVHEAPTVHETLIAAATQRARPLRSIAPRIPERVAFVVDKALELEKQDRWPSAQEMRRALKNARGHTVPIVVAQPLSSATDLQVRRPDLGDLAGHAADDDDPTVHRVAPPRSTPPPPLDDDPTAHSPVPTARVAPPNVAPAHHLGAMLAGGATLALQHASSGRTPVSRQQPFTAHMQTVRHSPESTGPVQLAPIQRAQHPSVPPPPPSLGGPAPAPAPAPASANVSRALVVVTVLLVVILVAIGGYVMHRRGFRSTDHTVATDARLV